MALLPSDGRRGVAKDNGPPPPVVLRLGGDDAALTMLAADWQADRAMVSQLVAAAYPGPLCQGVDCQFWDRQFHELYHRDGNHGNCESVNVTVLCTFCHQCFHLRQAERNGSHLIWIPPEWGCGFTQGQINWLCRTAYLGSGSGRSEETKVVTACQMTIAALKSMNIPLLDAKGWGNDSPEMLGRALARLPPGRRNAVNLDGLFLLPAPRHIVGGRDLWPEMCAEWRRRPESYGAWSPALWGGIYKKVEAVLRQSRR